VHALICQEGLGDFYRKQDRVAEPLKDRALSAVDHVALEKTQNSVESANRSARAVFRVSGMSCMGCVWLIERLAERQAGIIQVEVSLTLQSLDLTWSPKCFDLCALAEELLRFGYRLDAEPLPLDRATRWSPLTIRAVLSLIFTGNALLLVAYSRVADSAILTALLSLACLSFTCLLGAAPFFQSVYHAAQIRRWHSDALPALMIFLGLAYFAYRVSAGEFSVGLAAFAGSLLVSVFILARLIGTQVHRRFR
jgi:Cu2+-exporting ATPase